MKQDDLTLWNEVIKTVTPLDKKQKAPLLTRLFSRRFFHLGKPPLSTRLDLHHFTLQEAFTAFTTFVDEHNALGTRQIIVITGKGPDGKGALRKELPLWAERPDVQSKITRIEAAPVRMGGEGAFIIYLKRKK